MPPDQARKYLKMVNLVKNGGSRSTEHNQREGNRHTVCLASVMNTLYISSLVFYFSGLRSFISGPKMAENPKILSIKVAKGVENTIKVKVINLKRGPDNSGDDYLHLLSCALFLSIYRPPFWPKIG